MKIELLTRPYKQMIGLARYSVAICDALAKAGVEYRAVTPTYPLLVQAVDTLLRPTGMDVRTFFTTYPVAAPLQRTTLKHLTTQQMAILLWFRPFLNPTVITVHDIVPYLVRHDRNQSTFQHPADIVFDELAMRGLKRASALISDSTFTKHTIVEALGCKPERVFVVPLGVTHEVFRPMHVNDDFRERYKLDAQFRYILYVGSENPRKNLSRLLEAFALVRERVQDVKLIKLGSVEYLPQAEELQRKVRQLGLKNDVLFYDHVSDNDLALFYNAADLFVFPSLHEGFGLPPLEAMACGTPVVCSDAASLPEVVGDAAILINPHNIESLANAMHLVVTQPTMAEALREKGRAHATEFSWERTARETIKVYERVISDQRRK